MHQRPRTSKLVAAAIAVAAAVACGAVASHVATPSPRTLVVPRQLNASAPLPAHVSGTPRRSLALFTRGWRTIRVGTVAVTVSPSYPDPDEAARRWGSFLEDLVHGAELTGVTLYLAPGGEVWGMCGTGASGCYVPTANHIVSIGDTSDGIRPEAVVAHEYGHHVAASRKNAPWPALDWGTKRWATAMGVCVATRRHRMFPNDEGLRYQLNPGEAFAETYRVLNGQPLSDDADDWSIVADFFRPNARLLDAVRRDVVQPWNGPTEVVRTGRLGSSGTARIRLATPLDGTLDFRVAGATAGGSTAGRRTVCGTRRTTLTLAGEPGGRYVLTAFRP